MKATLALKIIFSLQNAEALLFTISAFRNQPPCFGNSQQAILIPYFCAQQLYPTTMVKSHDLTNFGFNQDLICTLLMTFLSPILHVHS